MKKLNKFFKFLIYAMPAVLFFSYEPIMHFGASQSMNFELSLPLIWLIIFDLTGSIIMIKRKLFFKNFGKKWLWLLFPLWLTASVLWSLNSLRGLLTVGIIWLVYLAGYLMWGLRSLFSDVSFKENFWKVFFISSYIICAICLLQCILDLVGVSKEWSLICTGCTYHMFGFPHPDGFAIEPQFMGNLLLAPTIVAGYFAFKNKKYLIPLAIFSITLFLTFSRGAIYALLIGLITLTIITLIKAQKKLKPVAKEAGLMWVVVVLSFIFTLNLQGLMALMSPTSDTYQTGVAKVINQLSLGTIDIGSNSPVENQTGEPEKSAENREEPVENSVDNSTSEESIFDGYVEESTETRLMLSGVALEAWKKDLTTIIFGAGIGGAGQALYVNGLSESPKEIVQNQYISLLLETGLVGISLFLLTLILAVKAVLKSKNWPMVISLMVAYALSICFFSGLPNALHIYLLPIVFTLL